MIDLILNAKSRLLATTSTHDAPLTPVQNTNPEAMPVSADVDLDSKAIIETELGDARKGHAAAKSRGHTKAVEAYENLISELERASSPVTANDTSDQPGLPCSNPADSVVDEGGSEAEHADDVILSERQQPCQLEADPSDETDGLDPADPNGIDPLKQDTTASTEDPISNGAAFDMLIDGDDEEDEPIVQELTNNDGGIEPDSTQPLLIDDVSQGPPTLD